MNTNKESHPTETGVNRLSTKTTKAKPLSAEELKAAFERIFGPPVPGEVPAVLDPCECGKPSVIKIVVEQQFYLNSLRRNSDGEWIREHRQWFDDNYRDDEFFCEPCYEGIKDFIFRFQG